MKWFDYTIDVHGAVIVSDQECLSTASLSEGEIDQQIADLKKDLDRVAREMKSALRTQNKSPLL